MLDNKKEEYFAPVHCKDCPNTSEALANLKKPSMKAVKTASKKTYLCNVHANIRGYTTNSKFICLEDYIEKQKKLRESTEDKKQDTQTTLNDLC